MTEQLNALTMAVSSEHARATAMPQLLTGSVAAPEPPKRRGRPPNWMKAAEAAVVVPEPEPKGRAKRSAAYWEAMTPEERSREMQRRINSRTAKAAKKAAKKVGGGGNMAAKYTDDFRRRVVREVEPFGKSTVQQVSKKHSLPWITVDSWRKKPRLQPNQS
jgi:hypothetical protein